MAQTSVHVHVRAMAKHNGVPVILHSDHCAKKLLPWFNGIGEETNILLAYNELNSLSPYFIIAMVSRRKGEVDRVGGSVFFGYGSRQAQEIQTAMDIDTGRERNGLHNLYEEKGYLQVQIGTYKKYYDLCV
ncbi:Aldolase-type TIM barrel [Phytophthora cactorum]|nr:Aldolase-type TIM barrel [Phytophthora cactorum]KAF1795035.1 Aldolase-type TIM barrel [Phytophthora cactorum]